MTKTFVAGWLTAFCLTVGLVAPSSHAAAAPAETPRVQPLKQGDEMLTRLKNGLTVYIIRDARFPLVCTRLYVGTGSANERPDQAGISHVLEHMVFKGTHNRPKGRIAQDVEALGGYLNAATSFDMTYYLTDMPARHWKTGMDVVRDMAFNATLDADELESEKKVVISELHGDDDEPRRRLFESLQVAGLKNSVYGRPIIGFEETIRAITAQDLRDYIAAWYQPQNMLLLVAGDIDPQQVLTHAEELFGGLKNTSDMAAPAPVDLARAPGGPQVEVVRGPWKKVYLGLALPAPGLPDIRSVDLDVLAYVLGGDGTSTLYRKYQYEKRLVDSISMGNMSLKRAGLLYVSATLDVNNLPTFWEGLTQDLGALATTDFAPGDAIERARCNLADAMDRAGETLNGLASWRGTVQFEMGGRQGERNLRSALDAVDAARLKEAVRQWLRPERLRVRLLVPQDAQIPDLEAVLKRNWPSGQAPDSLAGGAGDVAAPERLDLGKGRTLILQRDATVPYVALSFRQGGGNALLDAGQQGLAELTARTLTDGYGDMDAQAVERWFSERAAALSASAGIQTFSVDLSGPARYTGDYFRQLDAMLRSPRFTRKDMERQAQNMKAALARRHDNPQALLFSRVRPFLFRDHCYGFDGLGTPENLDRFTRDDMLAYWKRQAALPWVLTITGDFDPAAVREWAAQLPVPDAAFAGVQAPQWTADRSAGLTMPGRNQAYLLQVFPTVPQDHPDAPALMLLDAVLSGQSGLLFSKMRDEQGLGYTVTSFYQSLPETGLMAFYIGTTPDRVEQARKGFAGVIEDVRQNPLPAALLEKGLNRLEGDYHRGRQSLGSRSTESATLAILGLPDSFRRDVLDKAARLTPADVQAAARKYLDPAARRELLLTPQAGGAAPAAAPAAR